MAEKQKKTVNMEYRSLGNTGLKVSAIGYGNWVTGHTKEDEERNIEIMKKCFDHGVNFFDTAEIYGEGEAEEQMGKALKALNAPRYEYIVSTKIFWRYLPGNSWDPNSVGLSRKHIFDAFNTSLKKLDCEYIDIIFCHRFDIETPLEETCRAFDELIKSGKLRYWGTSNWKASEIFEAMMVCEKYNLIKPSAEQCQYNLVNRENVEVDYRRLFEVYRYGTTIFSPLAGGILTGKYSQEGVDKDSRIGKVPQGDKDLLHYTDLYGDEEKAKETHEKFAKLRKLAEELGGDLVTLAIAWVIRSRNTSTALCGFSKLSQVESNLKAIEFSKKITQEVDEKIDEIFGTKPATGGNPRSGKPIPISGRR